MTLKYAKMASLHNAVLCNSQKYPWTLRDTTLDVVFADSIRGDLVISALQNHVANFAQSKLLVTNLDGA